MIQAGLKIAPACEPISAAETLGRPFSCPGRGPQDHEQLLRKRPAAPAPVPRLGRSALRL